MENTHPGKNPHGAGTVPAPQRVLFAMVGFFTIAFGQSRPSIRRIDLPESARKRHSDTNNPPPSGRTIAGCAGAQKGCYRAQHRPQMSLWRVRCPCRFSPLALGKNTPSPLRKSARTLYLPRTTGFRSALPGRQRMNRHEQLLAQQLLYLGNYVLGFEGLYDVTVRSQ